MSDSMFSMRLSARFAWVALLLTTSSSWAEQFTYMDADGNKVSIDLPKGAKLPSLPPGAKLIGAKKANTQKQTESGKADDNKDQSESNKQDAQQPPEPKVIRRESTLSDDANPDEFKAAVGEDGKVAFEFRNQPWLDLVQWLADISDQPLDWLELPSDRVNLRSPGRYTVAQTRDLFNRYLLARGYTLLEIDGGLTVAKTESINPAIVPRFAPEQLNSLPRYSFVRVSLDTGWLSAEKLAAELKPMISANGRLTALTTTNRIEAMDAAANLGQIASLLSQERSLTAQEALAPEFVLRYLPAEEAKTLLEQFLGIEKQKETAITQKLLQQLQRGAQRGGAPAPTAKKPEISIVANTRRNSILIRAAADRVVVAQEFLKRIDVPGETMRGLADIKSRVQVFRLASLDPEKLIEIISEMNVLQPDTRIRVDKDNKALIVSGSIADRYVINSLIERLDGSSRKFEVIPLRRLDPVEVAESITFLMGQEKEKKNKQRSRYSYYSRYDRDDDDKKKETDKFRVAANVRLRQIMVWANDQELDQVESLLIKLGELPPPGGSPRTRRLLEASATPETLQYLKRLQKQWSQISSNPLTLPNVDRFTEPNLPETASGAKQNQTAPSDAKPTPPKPEKEPSTPSGSPQSSTADDETIAWQSDQRKLTLVQTQQPDTTPHQIRSSEQFDQVFGSKQSSVSLNHSDAIRSTKTGAPIRIELDDQGNLVLLSDDTKALDRLENLMLQIKPPKRPYVVFHIKHASASWMRTNLEAYFKDLDQKDDSIEKRWYSWYWGEDDDDDDKTSPSGLGKGAPLRFVDDIDTNTIVVNGASREQLRTIEELINLWDVPEPVNKRKVRVTKLVAINYGQAGKIAETVKEAYRDLLSSNDKTFAKNRNGGAGGGNGGSKNVTKSRQGSGSGLEDSKSGRDGGGTDFSFKGKLSLGIDSVGNTLLVSAEGEPLLELVCDMIGQLDQAARPSGDVEVVNLPGLISSDSLQQALRAMNAKESRSSSKSPQQPGGIDSGGSGSRQRRRPNNQSSN